MNSEPQVATLDASRPSWRRLVPATRRGSLVLSGSLVMLLGTGIVSASNFFFNVAVARMLGPAEFSHVAATTTMLMLFSAIGLSFQMVCAKFVARNESPFAKHRVYRGLLLKGSLIGSMVGILLAGSSAWIADLLRLPSAGLVGLIAVAIALSVPLGVKRGGLQGLCAFPSLAGNYITEALIKLVCGLVLVGLGYGVFGAIGAVAASVIAAVTLLPARFDDGARSECEIVPASFREGIQAIVFFVGQVIITNIDILLVKSFFPPDEAGHYAAVALFCRLLYFASWSIVSAMFPISAAATDSRPGVLRTALLMVLGLAAAFMTAVTLMPGFLIRLVLGKEFSEAGELLGYYSAGTAIYCLSVVLITYEMSRKIANTGWLQLLIAALNVIGISLFHDSLKQVITVQIVLMTTLLATVSLPFLRSWILTPRRIATP